MKENNDKKYDIIGDIHGHADELEFLLKALGYSRTSGDFRHPEGRKVIFLGDYIDRGPKIREVLEIVRGMVDAEQALAILGNHEVNAIRYAAIGSNGQPLRDRSPKNQGQHQATLDQIPDPEEWTAWMEWLATLPLSLNLDGLRAVHASWDDAAIAELNGIGALQGFTLERYSVKGTPEYESISRVVNGPEILLPKGFTYPAADGVLRPEIRIKWWADLTNATARDALFPHDPEMPEIPLVEIPSTGYAEDAPPTFFGHYALKDTVPAPIRPNLACLDYGMGKKGFLCAYRWDGETTIDPAKFIGLVVVEKISINNLRLKRKERHVGSL